MKKKILLTGATGLVGSHLLTQFLGKGFDVVCLLRQRNGVEPRRRLKTVLDVVTPCPENAEALASRVQIVCGDITREHLGLNDNEYRTLRSQISHVFHCAASTSFSPEVAAQQWKCNVGGTENIIRFALDDDPVESLHYISSAYVAGDREGIIYEDELDKDQGFNNGYERSKFFAEKMLQQYRKQSDVKVTIYRPSIIVGDYYTGTTTLFNGMYLYLRFLHVIKKSFRKMKENGKVHVPIRGIGNPETTKNFVSVDYVARMIMTIFECPEAHGGTYHITDDDPPTLGFIKKVMEDVLGITGTQCVDRESFRLSPPTDIEKLLMEETWIYQPYLLKEPSFDKSNLKAVLGNSAACTCPPMNQEALTRMFNYAVKTKWGKKHRTPGEMFSQAQKQFVIPETAKKENHLVIKYFEEFIPAVIEKSLFAELDNLNTVMGFLFTDSDKNITITMEQGRILRIEKTLSENREVSFVLDSRTFLEIVSGKLSPQQSFFMNRSSIQGDIEKGLKLAAIFKKFIQEHPFRLYEM